MEFTFDFTADKLAQCITKNKNPEEWFEGLYEQLPKFGIVTPARVAGFISQCQHESADFTILTENLNYGAKGLMTIFKKYYPDEALAKAHERKPELLIVSMVAAWAMVPSLVVMVINSVVGVWCNLLVVQTTLSVAETYLVTIV